MTFLSYSGNIRSETDAGVIATLKRKGWQDATQPDYDPATQTISWDGNGWVVADIPKQTEEQIPKWAERLVSSLGAKAGLTDQQISAVVLDAKTISATAVVADPIADGGPISVKP